MNFRDGRKEKASVALEITPLVDVVFLIIRLFYAVIDWREKEFRFGAFFDAKIPL